MLQTKKQSLTCWRKTIFTLSFIVVIQAHKMLGLFKLRLLWYHPLHTGKTLTKKDVLDMTLNCILSGTDSGDLKSVKYSLCSHIRSEMVVYVRVPSIGQIDLFKTYSYLIGSDEKNIRNNYTNTYIHTYIHILSSTETVSLYYNSSVWQDT